MKTHKIKPIVVSPYWHRGKLTVFYCHSEILEVTVPRPLLNQLVQLCDGQRTREKVINTLGKSWEKESVRGLIKSLEQNKIICDASSVGDYFWHFVSNPTLFARELSNEEILRLVDKAGKRNIVGPAGIQIPVKSSHLHELIERRRSIRAFSCDTVNMEGIAQMLWAGYGIVGSPHLVDENSPQRIKVWQAHKFVRHTVPSAGALYPIRLSLVLLRSIGRHEAGIYDVLFRELGMIELAPMENDLFCVLRSFADHTICNNAQGVIVVSGSFQLSGEKYGNRSFLYVPIEAGHVAQNIHLSAVENGIGTVEIGGFLEEPMKKALRLPSSFWPFTTILFGYPETSTSGKENVAKNLELRWAPPAISSYELPFSMVFARPRGKVSRDLACGRAKNPHTALAKAVSETYEWDACGQIPTNPIRASFRELEGAIDPQIIVCYHERQYQMRQFPLKPFDEKVRYSWVEGSNSFTGKKIYILADCVYFPYTPHTPRYTMANSSGTAANPDKNEAVRHAVLELVERDAFMIVWLNRLEMPRVSGKSLPGWAQKRIDGLKRAGFRVEIKDFTLDLAPVVFVFAQNEVLPMTTCSACSSFDVSRALEHALEEVEAAIYCRLRNPTVKAIHPKDVRRTYHHGDLYGQQKYFRRADFLAEGGKTIKFAGVAKNEPRSWGVLLERFEVMKLPHLTVGLGNGSQNTEITELSIAKVFVPGMIPMSFGYGLEPCGMERIYTLPNRLGFRTAPPKYGELTRFPHPYT